MKITHVENMIVSIPLAHPVKTSIHTYTSRDFNVVLIDTDEGIQGFGYARGGELVHAAIEVLKQEVIGEDPFMVEKLWNKMFHKNLMQGRKGAVIRGISTIDIALWDIIGKAANKPVAHILGGFRDEIPCYVSFGYYQEGKTIKDLAAEAEEMVRRGFKNFKIRTGGASLKEDLERIKVVRDIIGYDCDMMLDANNSYDDYTTAIRAGRKFEEFGIRWLEEPTMPDNLDGSAKVAEVLDMAVATGEQECTRWGFKDIIQKKAADILQPDVTVVGGISEWMKVSAMASAWNHPIAPHYFFDVHVHCAAASDATIYLEYFPSDSPCISFDRVLKEPLVPHNSMLKVPDKPGLGIELNMEEVKKLRKK